jgi:A/G-specific adenine glycosylase
MTRQLWALSETLVPRKHVFDFNQALMDFGATVCIARKPQCLFCPMRSHCRTVNPGKQSNPGNPSNLNGHSGRRRR